MAVVFSLLLRRFFGTLSVPQHIRDAGSLDIFKGQLKTVPFRRAFLN